MPAAEPALSMRRLPLFTSSALPASPFACRAPAPPVTETLPHPTSRRASGSTRGPAPGPMSTPNAPGQQPPPPRRQRSLSHPAAATRPPLATAPRHSSCRRPAASARPRHPSALQPPGLRQDPLARRILPGRRARRGKAHVRAQHYRRSDYRVDFSPFFGAKLHTKIWQPTLM